MSAKLRTPLLLATGMLLGSGATLGIAAWAARGTPGLSWQQVNLFAEVYERIRNDYIDDVPEEKLIGGAVRGLVSGLDQYSTYLDAKEYGEMRINTAGAYSGIGIEISLSDRQLKVLATIDDSPAARAGIRSGDVIVAVDEVPVDPQQLDIAVERLRGKPGAHVKLQVQRAAVAQPLLFDLVRRKVQVHSVQSEVLEPGYAYVHINQFSETTANDFSDALKTLQSHSPLRGLVLDLRSNPGGVLEAAVDVADALLDRGTIVTAKGRAMGADFAMQAQPGDLLNGAPIVVLVNGGSASAAEIVAGALKDHRRARLVGQTTYGKGLVQTVMPLSQGGALKLTTSRYYTPSGASIQQRGITPDVSVTKTVAEPAPGSSKLLAGDAELRVALAELKTLPNDKRESVDSPTKTTGH